MEKRMGRPCLRRKINFDPSIDYFKPRGVSMSSLEAVELKKEEVEAMRLKNIRNLDQRECAKKMKTSPATLQRILSSAYQKITIALTEGKAIKIINK